MITLYESAHCSFPFFEYLFVSLGIVEEDLVHGILGFHVKKDPGVNAGRYVFVTSDLTLYNSFEFIHSQTPPMSATQHNILLD